jgi:hypothetical protein
LASLSGSIAAVKAIIEKWRASMKAMTCGARPRGPLSAGRGSQ